MAHGTHQGDSIRPGYPLIVTAGVIRSDDTVLIARRESGPLAGRWEFPGGKLEPGESPEACLARELQEELGLEVQVGDIFAVVYHEYPSGPILLLAYACRLPEDGASSPGAHSPPEDGGCPHEGPCPPSEDRAPRLTEVRGPEEAASRPGRAPCRWVKIPDLHRYAFAPADLPVVEKLQRTHGSQVPARG